MNTKKQGDLPRPFSIFKDEQRFNGTPIRAFEIWIHEQAEMAHHMAETETARQKQLDANGEDWAESAQRIEACFQVLKECDNGLKLIDVFRGVMHVSYAPRAA